MSEPILTVEGLRKVYRGRGRAADVVAVDDVSFEVCTGESLAIVGESGSGKTTTARIVVGLERPTAGAVVVAGHPRHYGRLTRASRKRHGRETAIVFQDPYHSLDPRQTVGAGLHEILRLQSDLGRSERAQRIAQLLDQVGLDAHTAEVRPRSLSGGQRQRVAIARALAAQPQVLVLDEAVSALDVSIQAQVLNLLADLREQLNITYLFISHDLAVVRQVSDRTVVMLNGRIIEQGTTADILGAPQHEYTKRLLAAVPRPGWTPGEHRAPSTLTGPPTLSQTGV